MAGLMVFGAAGFGGDALAKIKLKTLLAGLSDADAQGALRETLDNGTLAAVTRVGKPGGYWDDPAIRIPLPKPLSGLQKVMKPLGQSGLLDDVHLRMNRAAENAAPVAQGLFVAAIKSMTIKDAVGIVKGGPTSGTQYLQRTTTPGLTTAFTPPMENALQSTGAVDYLNRAIQRNNLQGVIKTDAKTWLGSYAVAMALDGLFHYVGAEETAIRRDPAKRTSQLLKKAFG
ncbi:MAG: DUF4197 domain-containing protein [Asticcacaulis sp.]